MQSPFQSRAFRMFFLTSLGLSPLWSLAQTEGAKVLPYELGLGRLCPELREQIQKDLAPLVWRVGAEGVSQVTFRLIDGFPLVADIQGAPFAYRAQLRRSFQASRCVANADVGRRYRIEVRFRRENENVDSPEEEALALSK